MSPNNDHIQTAGAELADGALAHARDRFMIPKGVTYLDGNSLGCLSKPALARTHDALEQQWGNGLIKSWLAADWVGLPYRVGDRIGGLVGAAPGQIVACDSTSINLYKAVSAALDMRPDRKVIVSHGDDFPTDLYILQSIAKEKQCEIRLATSEAGIIEAIGDDVAVVCLSHVNYRSAEIYDMERVSRKAHDHGALAVWDLSHTTGAVPCQLDASGADFAVGCGYKYLNGGPGAPAFVYAAERHHGDAVQPLTGWFGHREPFSFDGQYQPREGIGRFLCGTPPVLGLSALEGALEAFDGFSIEALYEKSQELTGRFIALFETSLAPLGFMLACERDPARRGSHISLRHDNGYEIMRALSDQGVIGDFRAPDLLRFGFAPLYNDVFEIEKLVSSLVEIMATGAWDCAEYRARQAVT